MNKVVMVILLYKFYPVLSFFILIEKSLKVLLMSRTIIINDYHCADDAITQVAEYI